MLKVRGAAEWTRLAGRPKPFTPARQLLPSHLSARLLPGKGGAAEQNGGAGLPLHYTPDGRLPKATKLSLVVTDAVRRWYLETEKEAERGDVVSSRPAPPRRCRPPSTGV